MPNSHNIVAPASAATYTATYTSQPLALAPANTSLPTISGGVADSGRSLTTTNGSWTGTAPITYAYQWLTCDSAGNNCTPISGATLATYGVRSADRGTVSGRASPRRTSSASVSATSAATIVLNR